MLITHELSNYMVEVRRRIHSDPELGRKEFRTAEYIESELKGMGYEPQRVFGTGVVATHFSDAEGKCIALRADIDALPLQEADLTKAYASKTPGIMHACGHDGHVAIMLGLARYIKTNPEVITRGSVKLIFQPAEEYPGGAQGMIEEGVLDNPKVDMIIAGHLWPALPTGSIGFKEGPLMACSDNFSISVVGTSAHGAHPHKGNDAIIAAIHLASELQTIISRRVEPIRPAVLTIGRFVGGTGHNVIAEKVEMQGTVRATEDDVRHIIRSNMVAQCSGLEQAFGVRCHLDYKQGYPPLINDPDVIEFGRRASSKQFAPEQLIDLFELSMGAEDFSFFNRLVPGAMFRIGCCSGESCTPLHNSSFDFDEDALTSGCRFFLSFVSDYLK